MQASFQCKYFGAAIDLFQRRFEEDRFVVYGFRVRWLWRGKSYSRLRSLSWANDTDNRAVEYRKEVNGKYEGWYVRGPVGKLYL